MKEREGAENARSQAEQKISDLHQTVSDSKEDLKRAAREEEEARKAIESGDKHGRDLNRALGKATEAEQSASTAFAQAQLH